MEPKPVQRVRAFLDALPNDEVVTTAEVLAATKVSAGGTRIAVLKAHLKEYWCKPSYHQIYWGNPTAITALINHLQEEQ